MNPPYFIIHCAPILYPLRDIDIYAVLHISTQYLSATVTVCQPYVLSYTLIYDVRVPAPWLRELDRCFGHALWVMHVALSSEEIFIQYISPFMVCTVRLM